MFVIFFVLGSLSLLCLVESEKAFELLEKEDYFICRSCGSEITSAAAIISNLSTSAYSFTEPLLKENEDLREVLSKDNVEFPVIRSLQTTCQSVGEWQEVETWYPGYLWKPCMCPECGAFIGWIFKSSDTDEFQPKKFYTLVLSSVISESSIDSLLVYPRIQDDHRNSL